MELRSSTNKHLYDSIFLRKFINNLTKKGKVQGVEKALFIALKNLKFRTYLNPLILFLFLLNEIKPCITLKTLRLGSVVYQIPVPLICRKQLYKAIRLLIKAIRFPKRDAPLTKKVEWEFLSVLEKRSSLFKVNQVLYQISSNARAFTHYRWD